MTQTVSTESPMELSPRERLIQIMKREQALFIRQTLSQKPGYRGGKKAFEYFIRQKIVKAVEAGCGDAEALPAPQARQIHLLRLQILFRRIQLRKLRPVCGEGHRGLREQHPAQGVPRAKGWDAPDDFDINDEEE